MYCTSKPRSAFGVASQEIKEYSRLGNPGDVTLRVNEDNILLWKAYVKARSLLLASCSVMSSLTGQQ